MWRNWWKTTPSEKIYCIFICRNVSLNGGPQKELHVNKVLPKTGLFYPWFYKVQSATIPKRFKTRHYLKTRLHDLTCNSSSVKFSPSSFETLFKFLKEIFPVSSSSNNLKAFAISSLESFSLWNSSKDGSIYYLVLAGQFLLRQKHFTNMISIKTLKFRWFTYYLSFNYNITIQQHVLGLCIASFLLL